MFDYNTSVDTHPNPPTTEFIVGEKVRILFSSLLRSIAETNIFINIFFNRNLI